MQADIGSLQVSFWRTGNGKKAAAMQTWEGRSKVRVGKSGIGGCGVFARLALGREEVVDQVVGTVITDPDYSSRTCIDLGQSLSLETSGPFRYLNHACVSWVRERGLPNRIQIVSSTAEKRVDGP